MPHKDMLSSAMLTPDDALKLQEIIGLRVCEQSTTLSGSGWTYLHQNSNYDTWRKYHVHVGAGEPYVVTAENVDAIKTWCAKKFQAGTRYSVVLVTYTEVHDGVVLHEEKKPFQR